MWIATKPKVKVKILNTFVFDGFMFCVHYRYPVVPGKIDYVVSEYTTGVAIQIGSTEAYRSKWEAQQKVTEYLNNKRHLLSTAVAKHSVINRL